MPARPRLNKRFTMGDGIEQSPDPNSPGVWFDESTGEWRASSGIGVGLRPNQPITNIWRTIYTWNVPAIVPGTGSINSVVAQDVAMSGAVIGDPILVSPIGSFAVGLLFWGACYSANNVNLRAEYSGTVGAYTPGNVPLKIVDIQI